ncbi:Uncharacterized protein HZ326_27390 [Fusarium oxysporum f. sp. albedinis]|nr:Uncharacterized protein HZ326_27390 [Fusarium oxysporum f. sp. albedinis]
MQLSGDASSSAYDNRAGRRNSYGLLEHSWKTEVPGSEKQQPPSTPLSAGFLKDPLYPRSSSSSILLTSSSTTQSFGYADDIALYRTSPSLEENAELLGKDLTRVMDWGMDNKVALDPKKGEVIHFSRRCKGPAKTSAPDIVSSKHNYTIKPTDKPAV